MSMTSEMMDSIEKDLVFFGTTSNDGIPNVVPIGFARPLDEETILIADNYMLKTRKNLETNPQVSIIVENASECPYQFKGIAEVYESGKYLDTVIEWAENAMTKLNPKAAILVKITDIYSVKPGPEAGKKIE
ncbi:MAG: flavin-nucleotide-binding protein [Methanobacteriales archaeon Met13]